MRLVDTHLGMSMRTRFEAAMDKRKAVKNADVVDSKEVRLKLMQRVHNHEITLKQAQEELKQIQRNGKTRAQVWREN